MAHSRMTDEDWMRSCVKVAENRASIIRERTVWTILSLYVLWEARSMICKACLHSSAINKVLKK